MSFITHLFMKQLFTDFGGEKEELHNKLHWNTTHFKLSLVQYSHIMIYRKLRYIPYRRSNVFLHPINQNCLQLNVFLIYNTRYPLTKNWEHILKRSYNYEKKIGKEASMDKKSKLWNQTESYQFSKTLTIESIVSVLISRPITNSISSC